MRVKIITILCCLPFLFEAKAQDYLNAAGFRGGVSTGLFYEYFMDEENSGEMLMSFRHRGLQLTILRKYYRPAFLWDTDNFYFYFGWGGHVGYNNAVRCLDCLPVGPATPPTPPGGYPRDYRRTNFFALGADILLGMEYRFYVIPFSVGVEYKPYVGFFGPSHVARSFADFGGVIKYRF